MLGGLMIGFLWEGYNYWARGKWIYTVPWLEELKLFEMPPFGFVGFPVFTLEAWSMYAGLCLLGVAAPLAGKTILKRTRVIVGLLLATAFSTATIVGMEHFTISSTVPQLSDLPTATPSALSAVQDFGASTVFELAEADPFELAKEPELTAEAAVILVQTAQIATLRGIGGQHTGTLLHLGIRTVCELSLQDHASLSNRFDRHKTGVRPNGAEVRAWIRAAKRSCARELD